MASLLDRCHSQPTRSLAEGEVLVAEGERTGKLFVLVSGALRVTSGGAAIAEVAAKGAVIGETAELLDSAHGATVTATAPTVVHVVDDPAAFLADGDNAREVARMLAGRVDRLVSYLADVKSQYSGSGGHFDLLDEILGELTFGDQPAVEPGSEREPDAPY